MVSLLPPNSTKFEVNFEQAFARVSNIDIHTRTFNDAMNAPASVLPWLAWEKSVDVWNKNWNEEQKRKTILNAHKVHCHKGTIGALEIALSSLGFTVQVQEWFEMQPVGKPYTFRLFIDANQNSINKLQYKEIYKIVQSCKNLRSHIVGTKLTVTSSIQTYVGSMLMCGTEIEFSNPAGSLYLDGTWDLGSRFLDGIGKEFDSVDPLDTRYLFLDGEIYLNGNTIINGKGIK